MKSYSKSFLIWKKTENVGHWYPLHSKFYINHQIPQLFFSKSSDLIMLTKILPVYSGRVNTTFRASAENQSLSNDYTSQPATCVFASM